MSVKRSKEIAETSVWDWLVESAERERVKRAAYFRACQLDDHGSHAAADQVLRDADIAEDIIAWRRRHIEWLAKT